MALCESRAEHLLGVDTRQEYQSGLPFPTPGDLPHPEIELLSLASPALASSFFTTNATWEACFGLKGKKKPGFEMKIEINA